MKIGIIMDPIQRIKIDKDSSFAMLLAAQVRDCDLYYMEQSDLYLDQDQACGSCRSIRVVDDPSHWFDLGEREQRPLSDLDIILMRKDPPVDADYLSATYMLERAQQQGVRVVNDPRSLRDVNEKLYCLNFPELMTATIVSSDPQCLRDFLAKHTDIIIKPLHSMGGDSIYRLTQSDTNLSVILESMTRRGQHAVMAQKTIPEISDGDKRILMINGKPVSHALARIPQTGETRGNLAAGGSAKARPLNQRDREICERVGPTLVEKGLYFVGLDVIGDYLTEINVTSPTCIRELDRACDLDIAGDLIDSLMSA